MPMVATAAAAAVSWVSSAAAAAATAIIGAGASVGLSATATAAIWNTAVLTAASLAVTPLLQPNVGLGGSPISFKADPAAPIPGVMGRFGVGGRQMHGNVWGKGNLYLSFATALSLGPISGVAEFKANDTVVTFPGSQGLAANVEPYKDKMWMTYRLGLPTDAALSPPSGVDDGTPGMTEWTSAHKAPMIAHSFWTLKNNSKRASYEGGVPKPLWTLLGMLVWDPREDSTYPGGSGSQRRDDWTTWAYSENPHLHALAWVRGHHKLNTDGSIDRTKRLAGVGAPDEAIDIAAFVEGANISDANGWVISGEWTTQDDKWQTLAAMLQAGGAVPLNRGAMIGCMTEAPRASILTLTKDDLADGPVRIGVMASRRDRPNTIIPRYRSEPHKWEEVPAGPVSAETYVTEDRGEERTREISYRYVRQAKQAAELAAYDLANARETLRPTIPAKPYMLGLRAGDAFTVEAPETGMNGQKLVLMRRPFDPASAVVTLECRSETDAKHAWALGQSANPPESPSLTSPGRDTPAPEEGEWTAVAGSITGDDGAEIPVIVITGAVESEVADQVIFEYRRDGATDWIPAGLEGPEVETKQIRGLAPGDWEVAVSYRANRNTSDRLILDPVTLSGIIVPLTPDVLDDADVLRRPGGGDLDYTGDLNATDGADWTTNVFSRPTELTDGRVLAGLTADGDVNRPIPVPILDGSNVLRRAGGGVFTGELDAVDSTYVDNSVGTLENDLITGTVRPLEVENQGPLTTFTPPTYAGNATAYAALGAGRVYLDSTNGNQPATTYSPAAAPGSGAKALSGSAGSTVASATVAGVEAGSLIEINAFFNAPALDADGPMTGYIRFEEGSGGTWDQIGDDISVTINSQGVELPGPSWGGDRSNESCSDFGVRSGSVTYRATFTRTGGSGLYGSGYQMSGSVKITPPAS